MAVIDFHNHVYPPKYFEAIQAGPGAYEVTFDANLLVAIIWVDGIDFERIA